MTEYEFTLRDGSKVYELVDGHEDFWVFMKGLKAVSGKPVKPEGTDDETVSTRKR